MELVRRVWARATTGTYERDFGTLMSLDSM